MVSARVRLALQAMRYYRFWIYATNAVLLLSVVVFICVATALLADPRRSIISTSVFNLHQPSLVFIYAGLVIQGIALPLIGFLGAIKLNEKLLQTYWMVLLLLIGGDILMGILWMLRFQKAVGGLVPDLKVRFSAEYGKDPDFSHVWDLLQRSGRCCGVQSPSDFNHSLWERSFHTWDLYPSQVAVPETCCKALPPVEVPWSWISREVPAGRREVYGTGKHRQHLREHREHPSTTTTSAMTLPDVYNSSGHATLAKQSHSVPDSPLESNGSVCWKVWPALSNDIHEVGCAQLVLDWVQHTGEVLFILGCCVLTFVKLCFAAILRYELREMIHKIKILKGEIASQEVNNIFSAAGVSAPRATPAVIAVESESLGETPTCRANEEENEELESPSERCSLLGKRNSLNNVNETPPTNAMITTPSLATRFNEAANDSDTGSNCALLSERPLTTAKDRFFNRCERDRLIKEWGDRSYENGYSRTNGNNNEYHELREMKQTQI